MSEKKPYSNNNIVCVYPINIKTAQPIGPKFCVGPPMIYNFVKFKNAPKKFENPQTYFCYCVVLYNEKMLTDRAKLKS